MSLSSRITDVIQAIGVAIKGKQATLVSGTNIKTINNQSLLGSGDLIISGGGSTTQIARMASTQASTVTTLANINQLSLAMEANGVYQVDAFVTFQSAATTNGLGLGFTAPSGATCMLEVVVPITSTAVSTQLRTIFPNASATSNSGVVLGTGVTASNSNHTARISGIIRNGATAGNFQLQFRSEVASSAITLQIGSELHITKVG